MVKWRRNRYLIIQVYCDPNCKLDKHLILNSIFDSVLTLFGVLGASGMYLNLIYYDVEMRRGILRCVHTVVPLVRAALSLIWHIRSCPIFIRVLKITGSVKKAREILNSFPQSKIMGDEEAVPEV